MPSIPATILDFAPSAASGTPHLTHTVAVGSVGLPQLWQKFPPLDGAQPQETHTTACFATSLPQFLQYIFASSC
jgi:hypothetical protein